MHVHVFKIFSYVCLSYFGLQQIKHSTPPPTPEEDNTPPPPVAARPEKTKSIVSILYGYQTGKEKNFYIDFRISDYVTIDHLILEGPTQVKNLY